MTKAIWAMMAALAAGAAQAGGYTAPTEETDVVVVSPAPEDEPTTPGDWIADGWVLDEDGHWSKGHTSVGSGAGGVVDPHGDTGALVGGTAGEIMDCAPCAPPESPVEDDDAASHDATPETAPSDAAIPVVLTPPPAIPTSTRKDDDAPDASASAPAPHPILTVLPDRATVRTAPRADARPLGVILKGTQVRTQPADRPDWIAVRLKGGGLGYVTAADLVPAPGAVPDEPES